MASYLVGVDVGTGSARAGVFDVEGKRVEEDPGYDWEPRKYLGDAWGLIELRNRPVIAIHEMRIAHPARAADPAFQVPADWIRCEKKYGKVSILPMAGSTATSIPLNFFLMNALAQGRSVPLMVQFRYTAGLANAAEDWPDLVALVKSAAVLGILEDQFIPGSASTSADGLSQTVSFDGGKMRDELEKKVKKLRNAIHGIRLMVV